MHILWLLCDKPRCGVVNKIRLAAKYKMCPKEAMLRDDQDADDYICSFLYKDINKFWQKKNSKFSNK